MKIGIFGGTFNPVHYGHLRAAEEVRETLKLDKIIFIPAKSPPLKTKNITPARHRYEMLRTALLDQEDFELSDIEFKLRGKSYSARTIELFTKAYPATDFYFMLGIDAFMEIPQWWKPEKLIYSTHFAIISRPGFSFMNLQKSPYLETNKRILKQLDESDVHFHTLKLRGGKRAVLLRLTPIDISSTEIRTRIKKRGSIKYLLPPAVESYIIFNKLYKK
jgi:nicotinate-nucleotide adenylyltransferase